MCLTTQQVDGPLREGHEEDMEGFEAEWYLSSVSSTVGGAIQAVESVSPSGNGAADAESARLLKVLKEIQGQLPEDIDAITKAADKKKLSTAERLAAAVGAIPPQATILTQVVKSDQALAVSHDLAPGCTPLTPSTPSKANVSAPTRALVGWAARMCPLRDSMASLRADPFDDPLTGDPRFAPFLGSRLAEYISSAGTRLDRMRDALAEVPATGIPAVDEYRASLASRVKKARAKLPEGDRFFLMQLPVGQLKKQVRQVSRATAGLEPAADLPDLVAGHPELLASYDLAPQCEPLTSSGEPGATPLPSAEDGGDLAACRDGTCQIKVSKPVVVSVNGGRYLLSAADNGLSIVRDTGYMVIGAGGTGRFGMTGGKTTEFRVKAHTPDGAVLDISTSE